MSEVLRSWKAGSASRLVWIDYDAYAHTIFSSSSPEWLRDPVRRVSALEQAQRIVSSQVLTIDLAAPCLAAAGNTQGGGVGAITDALSADAPAAYLATLLDAIGHRLGQRMDVVVSVPSPRDLLIAAGMSADETPSFNDLDDVGMALADLARGLSSKTIHGLLVTISEPARFEADDAEATGSLIAAVRHFGWAAAVATPSTGWPPPDTLLSDVDADLFLYPEVSLQDVVALGNRKVGGGLGKAFWSDSSGGAGSASGVALYGAIPSAMQPEQVLTRLSTLAPAQA